MFVHVVQTSKGDLWPKCYLSEKRAKEKARKLKGCYYTLEISFKGIHIQ